MVSKPHKHKAQPSKTPKQKKLSQEELTRRRYLHFWNSIGLEQVDFEVLWRNNATKIVLISIVENLKIRLDSINVRVAMLEVLYSGIPDVNKAGPYIKENIDALFEARQKELKTLYEEGKELETKIIVDPVQVNQLKPK